MKRIIHVASITGGKGTLFFVGQTEDALYASMAGYCRRHDKKLAKANDLSDREVTAKFISSADDVTGVVGTKELELDSFAVCEIICQKPSVSIHATEDEAFARAVDCAMENLRNPDDDEVEARAGFKASLGEHEYLAEGDYEVHILTPTNHLTP